MQVVLYLYGLAVRIRLTYTSRTQDHPRRLSLSLDALLTTIMWAVLHRTAERQRRRPGAHQAHQPADTLFESTHIQNVVLVVVHPIALQL